MSGRVFYLREHRKLGTQRISLFLFGEAKTVHARMSSASKICHDGFTAAAVTMSLECHRNKRKLSSPFLAFSTVATAFNIKENTSGQGCL